MGQAKRFDCHCSSHSRIIEEYGKVPRLLVEVATNQSSSALEWPIPLSSSKFGISEQPAPYNRPVILAFRRRDLAGRVSFLGHKQSLHRANPFVAGSLR